jgi:hypothetical protein
MGPIREHTVSRNVHPDGVLVKGVLVSIEALERVLVS